MTAYLFPFLVVCACLIGACLVLAALNPASRVPRRPPFLPEALDPDAVVLVLHPGDLDRHALRIERALWDAHQRGN